ncbi:MAG: phosphate-starvation-inducible PsiE family protein [Gammaproteobacteria bacterium]|nr:phosphate-starvation-inducible PsiE family protein [Gammaproteobacteria bacterium]
MRFLHPIFHVVEIIGLVIIAIITIIAGIQEVQVMIERGSVTLSDLLMMFIYLEILAMVIIYLESGRLPIRIPLYIAIVALARYMILDMKGMSEWKILGISLAIVVLAAAVLILRYGHTKYPYAYGDGRRGKRSFDTRQSPDQHVIKES